MSSERQYPSLLFKYKALTDLKQLSRFFEAINECKLYFPNYKQLNDPLEGSGYVVEVDGYPGMSIFQAADMEDPCVSSCREQYRILSLSSDCFSPIMWSNYAGDFQGACIAYWTKGGFGEARAMNYLTKMKYSATGYSSDEEFETEIMNSFFYKHKDWKVEKEYRVVKKQNKNDTGFFEYDSSDIACIIFGHKIDNEIVGLIRNNIDYSIPLFRTYPGYRSFGINILDLNNEIDLDGSEPNYIRNIKGLVKNILQYNVGIIERG